MTETKRPEFDVDQSTLFKTTGYVEDPAWVPSPFDQFGTVQTAGTAGDDVHGDVREVSAAFQIGRVRDLMHAARALDPDDPTPADNVVLPGQDHRDESTAREEVFRLARRHIAEPVELGMTEARRRAAETESDAEVETESDGEKSEDERQENPDRTAAAGWTNQNG
jgi:hypothetical protein